MNLENAMWKQLCGGPERNSLMYIITHKLAIQIKNRLIESWNVTAGLRSEKLMLHFGADWGRGNKFYQKLVQIAQGLRNTFCWCQHTINGLQEVNYAGFHQGRLIQSKPSITEKYLISLWQCVTVRNAFSVKMSSKFRIQSHVYIWHILYKGNGCHYRRSNWLKTTILCKRGYPTFVTGKRALVIKLNRGTLDLSCYV